MFAKFKETALSVLPIMCIVYILSLTAAPLGSELNLRFAMGGFLLIVGLTFFLVGVDLGIMPIGERSGAALISKRNLKLLLLISFLIGFIVTVAEPDVQVLADQIQGVASGVNKWALVLMIALGVGFFVVIGLCRTVLSWNLRTVLVISYFLLFLIAFLCPAQFQGAAFDAGGATTGPMTVPFIMALGMGVASVRSAGSSSDGKNLNDSNFGLTGIASIGPIVAVCVYGLIHSFSGGAGASAAETVQSSKVLAGSGLSVFVELIPEVTKEVLFSLMPLCVMFALIQIFLLKMPPVQIRKMIKGILYCFLGLIFFLVGADGGFMPSGRVLGEKLGLAAVSKGGAWTFLIVAVAFIFGAITVCAEPAVWVLTEQVESVTGGIIKRKILMFALSFGVAFSISLSILKIIYGFSIWYILIPGYAFAILLTFFSPSLFTGIAFDSGGVASGPMTSTFILSFTLGSAFSSGNISEGAFGVIALVAMTPLIAIQILGIMFKIKTKKAVKKDEHV